jgi:hypothetical protein
MCSTYQILNFDRIPIYDEVDVLVVGGGSAGCCAALSAREFGEKSVTLVERYGYLGGTSTQMLDTFYGFFTPGETPRKVVGGIPDRVVNALDSANAIFLRANTYGAGTGVTYNPERLKLIWDQLLCAAGVKVLLHLNLVAMETDSQGILAAGIFWGKRGFVKIKGRRFIDASGDADLCYLSDIPSEKAGEKETAQTLTTTFRMSNVDLSVYAKAGGKKMLMDEMARAVDTNAYLLPRKEGSFHPMTQTGCVATVAVRVADIDATDFEELTEAEAEGRRQAFVYEQFLRDRIPGFAQANIIGLSHHIGVRETRRVYGEYRLTKDDCLQAAQFNDAILLCGAPIEDHRKSGTGTSETAWQYLPDGQAYQVPYRTIVPKNREEVWVVGRCFSATHDAHASCRSMAQTMAMGQAAGLAANISIDLECGAREVPHNLLQAKLIESGAVLQTPAHEACVEPDGWKRNFPT